MKSDTPRFAFGKNWKNFLSTLDDERIRTAADSLKEMLCLESLEGKTFLDAGCGSGLFSLVARSSGAVVSSFDYDIDCVNCTSYLKSKYFPDDNKWHIQRGDILDKKYVTGLDKFDIVYSWGVLHHTGNMWESLENATIPVKNGGYLYISIYNDQGFKSKIWRFMKKLYNVSPSFIKLIILVPVTIRSSFPIFIKGLLKLNPVQTWKEYKNQRGMSFIYDAIDWAGGYPFETAKPEEIFSFFKERKFSMERLKTCGGKHGCNEYLFINNQTG